MSKKFDPDLFKKAAAKMKPMKINGKLADFQAQADGADKLLAALGLTRDS